MIYPTLILSALLATTCSAAPLKRSLNPLDTTVVKFAAVLEAAEVGFYQQVLQKFKPEEFDELTSFSGDVLVKQMKLNMANEQAHLDFLVNALEAGGDKALTCEFDVSSFLTSPLSVLQNALSVESVGLGAYNFAATLISDKVLLGQAAEIGAAESFHTAVFATFVGLSTPAFPISFSPGEVLGLVGGIVTNFGKEGCDLGLVPFGSVSITAQGGKLTPGASLDFKSSNSSDSLAGKFCHAYIVDSFSSIPQPIEDCKIPSNFPGGPLVFGITADANPILLMDVVERVAVTHVGMIFVDGPGDGALAEGGSEGAAEGGAEGSAEEGVSSESASGAEGSSEGESSSGSEANKSSTNVTVNVDVTVNGWKNPPQGKAESGY